MAIVHEARCDYCEKRAPAVAFFDGKLTEYPEGWLLIFNAPGAGEGAHVVTPASLCSWLCVSNYAEAESDALTNEAV